MGLADAFNAEDRVNVKFSDFYKLVQQAGKYENVMNGVKCNVPHRYIREMVSGVSEEPQQAEGQQETPAPDGFEYAWEDEECSLRWACQRLRIQKIKL